MEATVADGTAKTASGAAERRLLATMPLHAITSVHGEAVADPDVACAALLHDDVENHARDLAPGGTRQAALTVLAGRFGGRTAGLAAAVTNPVYEPGPDPRAPSGPPRTRITSRPGQGRGRGTLRPRDGLRDRTGP
jgi:hypothetical protein